jgi:hypothetical protein
VDTLTPRPYQRAAVDALFGYWSRAEGNPVIVAPTGSGKSVILGLFCREAVTRYKGTRILVATHVKELVEQDHAALLRCSVPAGIWSAGCGRKERTDVLVASVQSIYRSILDHDPFDLLLIDECHLCPDRGMGMYRQLIERMRLQRPLVKVAGFTATPFRLGSGLLTDGDVFDDIAYEITIHELLAAGHLAPLTTRAGRQKIDLEGIRIQKGEYSTADLESSLAFDDVTQNALDEAIARGADRPFLVLDFAHLVETHGPVDAIRVRRRSKREGGGCVIDGCPCRECECGALVSIRSRECPECGFGFPQAPVHGAVASELAILSEPERHEVRVVRYSEHTKNGNKSLRVDYSNGFLDVAREFVCIEYGGYARARACSWWAKRAGGAVPRTVAEALERQEEIRKVAAVWTIRRGKYDEIVRVEEA